MKISRIFLMYLASILLLSSNANGRDLTHINTALNSVKLQGSGRLNWWGFHLYDAFFYRASNPSSSEFALDVRYQKSFKGISIANSSAEEMKKIGVPETQANLWGKELAAILPNIEPGDSLTAIYLPKQGTVFYYDGKPIGQIPGTEFSKAFFGIWLDSKTSVPKLRTELLGQGCPPPLFNEAC